MILQALVEYYDRKSSDSSAGLAPFGWINKHVDYLIVLSLQGECVNLEQKFSIEKGKYHYDKMYFLPAIGKQAMKHTNSGKDANLLWDNASFVFGLRNKGEIKRGSFISALDLWFPDLNESGVNAVKLFYQSLCENELMAKELFQKFELSDELDKRDPIFTFSLKGDLLPINYRKAVKDAYEIKVTELLGDGIVGTCLLTGNKNVQISKNEVVIKGVWGGQTAGTNIISFNKPAFESYGKKGRAGKNAPVGIETSFAYTTALNFLLRQGSSQRMQVGDTSTVFWSEKQSDMETAVVSLFDQPPKDDPDRNVKAIQTLYKSMHNGRYNKDDGDTRFYVLGLAPNAARIAVRFWHVGTVAEMAERIAQHFSDLEIVHGPNEAPFLSLFRLLVSTASLGKADNIPPNLAGDMMRAILEGSPYPQTLLGAVIRRIIAEQAKKDSKTNKQLQNVTYPRAALIKACINRSIHHSNLENKEELQVSLDEKNTNIGYRLGRLFVVLEQIQKEAHDKNLNATIRDRYYGAASCAPVTVFSTLLKLSTHHLRKMKNKGRVHNLEALKGSIIEGIPSDGFPPHLTLEDQGKFAIGYYHQRQHPSTYKGDSND